MPEIIHRSYFENEFVKAMPTSGARQKWLTMSTETPDRCGDVMVLAGMDATAFMKNPQFIWDHQQSGAEVSVIGKILQLQVVGNTLLALAEFATPELSPLADQIFQLSDAGYLPANSIGFRPIEWENNDTGGVTYTKWELVECSKCEVPMNPEAIDKSLKRSKSLTIELDVNAMEEIKSGREFSTANTKDFKERLQGIMEHCQSMMKKLDDAEPEDKGDAPPFDKTIPKQNFRSKLLRAEMLNRSIN